MPFSQDNQHPFFTHLQKLLNQSPAQPCRDFLDEFRQGGNWDQATLISGMKKFIAKANLSPEQRAHFYGNRYFGLHYSNQLADLWNQNNSAEIKAIQLQNLAPEEWHHTCQDNLLCLVYKGDQPAHALDKLFSGPTTIDCGMFCQLTLWFGLRYMLGDKQFNQVFGQWPFFLTQLLYNPVSKPNKPHQGNPLYEFMNKGDINSEGNQIQLTYLPNHKNYLHKHPSGSAQGQNCLVINNRYNQFDPSSSQVIDATKEQVEKMLVEAFNGPQTVHDRNALDKFKNTPDTIDPFHGLTHAELLQLAQIYQSTTITLEDLPSRHAEIQSIPNLNFNFNQLKQFCHKMLNHNTPSTTPDYSTLASDQLAPDQNLLERIPFENKTSMNFDHFEQKNSHQKQLLHICKQFCHSIMNQQSYSIILSGQAGIGKTASAVCCAKELSSRGKYVLWLSEVMLKSWMEQATSFEQIEQCQQQIREMLTTNPDAVFLDDDNLTGYAGRVLLEEVYYWYCTNSGKGLFITSNEEVTFKHCFGWKMDKQYHYPPFPGYQSEHYQNITLRNNLKSASLRKRKQGQSLAAIIDYKSYLELEKQGADIEFVTGFDNSTLASIRYNLIHHGTPGPAYYELSAVYKSWLRFFETGGLLNSDGKLEPSHKAVAVRAFEGTSKQLIAVELMEWDSDFSKKIYPDSFDQLLRVINYGHDNPGKRIAIINRTTWGQKGLIAQIEKQLPEEEKDRTMSRLHNMLDQEHVLLQSETRAVHSSADSEGIQQPTTHTLHSKHSPIKFWDTDHSNQASNTSNKDNDSHMPRCQII